MAQTSGGAVERMEELGPFVLRYDGVGCVLMRYQGPGGLVELPESVTEIGSYAFNQCFSVTEIHIPQGVTRIGQGAFRGCARLSQLALPANLREIDRMAFDCCASLTSMKIPGGVKRIGSGAFRGCLDLQTITLPPGVEVIGAHMFGPRYPKQILGLLPLMMGGRCRIDHTTLEDLLEECWVTEDDFFEIAAAYLSSGNQAVMGRARRLLCTNMDWAVEVLADLLNTYPTARHFHKAGELVASQSPANWPQAFFSFYAMAQTAGRKKAMRRLKELRTRFLE